MYTTPASHAHDVERCHPAQGETLMQEYAPLVKYIADGFAQPIGHLSD